MVFTIVILVLLLAVLVFVSGLPRFAVRQITQMRLQTNESIYEYLERTGVYTRDQFERLPKRPVEVMSRDGLKLNG